MQTLVELDPTQRQADEIVAIQQGQPCSWHHWLGNILLLREQLAAHPTGYWPIYFADTYTFSIAAFALWSSQRTPLLLPDTSALTLQGLAAEAERGEMQIGGYLGDSELPMRMAWQPTDSLPTLPSQAPLPLDCHTALRTSGSTGTPLTIVKQHDQLLSEVLLYAELWRPRLQNSTFLATVSHQHIYGLLFKVLLPVVLQTPFVAEMFTNPRYLLQQADKRSPATWVASPAQLKRLTRAQLADLQSESVTTIFSSGGLLQTAAANNIEKLFAQPAVEIYGSTETGVIAYRQQYQHREENLWQVMPGVDMQVTEDGLLQVCSPFTNGAWLNTSDRVDRRGPNSFVLQGRADRIVKVEEKRISLSAVERQLAALPEVSEARVIALPGKRQQLAAVLILSDAGIQAWSSQGRNPLIKTLRSCLAEQLETFSIPRRFRFVHDFPTTSQSKVTVANLAALFEDGERNILPIVTAANTTADTDPTVELSLRVPADLDYFDGHFNSFAVVPGVAQLLWVRHFAKLHLGFSGAVTRMSKIKFKAMLRPQQAFTMHLSCDPALTSLRFRLHQHDQDFCSGIMLDNAAPADV